MVKDVMKTLGTIIAHRIEVRIQVKVPTGKFPRTNEFYCFFTRVYSDFTFFIWVFHDTQQGKEVE